MSGFPSLIVINPDETLSKNLHYKFNFSVQCIFARKCMVIKWLCSIVMPVCGEWITSVVELGNGSSGRV